VVLTRSKHVFGLLRQSSS